MEITQLNKLGVEELSSSELKEQNGGIVMMIALVIIGITTLSK